jgi:prepilin-type processing-associated H-X9-DG protein
MDLESEEIIDYCTANNLNFVAFCNEILIHLSKVYLSGKVNYSFADGVANNIHDFMVSDHYLDSNNNTLSDPAYSIYLAFDAGEYYRKEDDKNIEPHVKYTNPQLEAILLNVEHS